jgi:transposase
MTKGSVEVITSVQRRRRWSAAEKERLVAASLEPGAVASEVVRAAGIHPSQLFGSCPVEWCSWSVAKPLASAPSVAL